MIKKRYITLLEIMIVILLIGIITSVVGYNVKGSLYKGKVFRTEQAQNQIRELLLLEVAKGAGIDEVVKFPKKFLKETGLPKNVSALLKDGWNDPFEISTNKDKTDIIVSSKNLKRFEENSKRNLDNGDEEEYY
jgi:general secretion pathway protein G